MNRRPFRIVWCSLLILAAAALVLSACSSSEDTDPGPPPTPKLPLKISDLTPTAGTATSVTLAWTSPALADKATIQYDLRHIGFGSEGAPWDSWTGTTAPGSDTQPGQQRTFEVAGLTSGETYSFRMSASTDGTEWSEASNTAVATAAPAFDTTAPGAVTRLQLFKGTSTSLTMVWPFAGDDGDFGKASEYIARYSTSPITAANWDAATPVPGPIFESDIAGMMETAIIDLTADQEYHVAVVAVDAASNRSDLSNVVSAVTVDLRTIYVNVEGTGDYPTIEEAVHAANIGDLVLVGPGRYTWTNQATGDSLLGLINVPRYYPGDDYYDFEVRGLAGAEATILDAELHSKVMSVTGGSTDEGGAREYAGITIDGFTFVNGRATATELTDEEGWSGAGLNLHLSDTVVRNCIFIGNEATNGGGLWIGGQGDALVENCVFENNVSNYGGAIMLINSDPRITVRDCTLRNNYARLAGGGIYAVNVAVTLENLLVVGNKSGDKGGGISVAGLHPGGEVLGCTVADNQADFGSGIRVTTNTILRIENSLLAFNTGSAAFSTAVKSGAEIGCTLVFGHDQGNQFPFDNTDLGGNLETDPLFCDRANYLLRTDSPCLPGNHPDAVECGLIGARGAGCVP